MSTNSLSSGVLWLLIKTNSSKKHLNDDNLKFIQEDIKVNTIDYYYSNVIARASKTMFNCRNEKLKIKSTGTEG